MFKIPKNTGVLAAGVFVIMLTSCSQKENKTTPTDRTVRVETLTVNDHDIAQSQIYSGTIQEGEGTALSFSAAGTIKSLSVKPGDKVVAGQKIGKLDDSSLKAAYDIANATLAQAQDAYNRMKILHDSHSLPDVKWFDVQQKLTQAQSAVDIARNALNDAVLTAPYSGIISEKSADIGQVVAPGIPVVKLIRINTVKAVISVPENEIGRFSMGQNVEITVGALGDKRFTGKLTEKGITASPLSRTYETKFTVDNQSGELLPGMICSVSVDNQNQENTIVLPQSAVLLDEHNVNFVWIDDNGKAMRRDVIVSNLRADGIEITSGLKDGDKVIVKGIQKVCNGTPVESVN